MNRKEANAIIASSVIDYCIERGIIEQLEDGTLDDADVALVRAQLDETAATEEPAEQSDQGV